MDKEELKKYILLNAFDGWKDTTDDNVMQAIDEFFDQYQPERSKREDLQITGYIENGKEYPISLPVQDTVL